MTATGAVQGGASEAQGSRRKGSERRPPPAVPSSARRSRAGAIDEARLEELLGALRAVREGDFTARLSTRGSGPFSQLAAEFNELAAANQRMSNELVRVGRIIGREGRMTERAALPRAGGAWTTRSLQSCSSFPRQTS